VLTLKRDGKMLSIPQNVRVVEIDVNNKSLGSFDLNIFRKAMLVLEKIRSQIKFLIRSKNVIDEFKPEAVHIYSPIPFFIGLYCKIRFQSKFYLSLHGTDVERIFKSRWLQYLLKIPDRILSVSPNSIERLKFIKLKEEIYCIGNGVNREIFYPRDVLRENQIICVAHLRWQKGHKFLIKAFSEFLKTYSDYKLILIGDGPDKTNLLDLTQTLGIENNVIFKGVMGREDVAIEISKSKLLVLSSLLEGFPKVVLESLAAGTPVLSTNVGNVSNVVGSAGVICDTESSQSLLNGLYEGINKIDDETFFETAEACIQDFTWEKIGSNLDEIIGRSDKEAGT
jgi:glycosyltransferase involved in cell wall biosynthesis